MASENAFRFMHLNTSAAELTPYTQMKLIAITALAAITIGTLSHTALAQAPEKTETPTVVAIAAGNKDFSTLFEAVKAAGLVDTLNGTGPFTIFVPNNEAFAKLPKGTVEDLLKPENKAKLTAILTYHVVPGRLTAADLATQAQANGGKVELTTVQGTKLTAMVNADGSVTLTDAKGGTSHVTQADVLQSNGVVHVIDTVVMPR